MTVACRELFKVHRTPEGDAAALQGLSLDAAAGEMVALLGPSGSGKSTLLRILAGLERPSAGSAAVAGRELTRLSGRALISARRELVGLVGQHAERALPPALGVGAAVALPLRLRGAGRRDAAARTAALLERVGLAGAEDARPHELSGGERQRAALAAAVAHAPPVVLADEPTGELDAAAAGEVLGVLRDLARDGATVVLVTHDPVGAHSADRVVRIRDGRVSQEGSGERLAAVVGRGGWLHVPEELLAAAGIGDRATVRAADGAVILEPAGGAPGPPAPGDPGAAPGAGETVEGVSASVEDLHVRFGSRTVFAGLNAAFAPGTFTAVTGRSGSGKSTLLRILAGLARPDAGAATIGDVVLDGLDREELAALRRARVGVVGQDPQLLGFLTAAEHAPPTWLDAVGLHERATQRVDRLSAGERQRVAIARALAGGRGLLLVDEPTSRLDEANAIAVADLLRGAAHRHGATVVCATHDPILAEAADRILALDPA